MALSCTHAQALSLSTMETAMHAATLTLDLDRDTIAFARRQAALI